ncbi:hypothetical protein TCAL_15463, partial [Tigriopus californicus]
CSCVAGISGQCKHTAALYEFINTETGESKTSEQQTWHRPSEVLLTKYPKGESILEILSNTSLDVTTSVRTEAQANLTQELQMFGLTSSSFYVCLTADREQGLTEYPKAKQKPELEQVVKSLLHNPAKLPEQFLSDINLSIEESRFFNKNVLCDMEKAIELCEASLGQASSPAWHNLRRFRISASRAGPIGGAKQDHTLLKYFFEEKSSNKYMQYGRETEPKARMRYEDQTGNKVLQTGAIISPIYPWLCASPDGIAIDGNGNLVVLEIKCPF